MKALTVVIVLYKEYDMIYGCIESVYKQKVSGLEIILVDNAPNDNETKKILQQYPKIKYHKNAKNLGYAGGANVGFKMAQGEFILVLTPDSRLLPDTISKTLPYIQSHPDVGVVGCKIYSYPHKLSKSTAYEFPNLVTHLFEYNVPFYLFYRKVFPTYHPYLNSLRDHQKEMEVKNMIGAFMLLRRKAGKGVGFFSKEFFMYREETDICKKLYNAGWKIVFLPVDGLVHLGGASWKDFQLAQCSGYYQKSTYLYFKKHKGVIYAEVLWIVGLISSIMSILFLSVLVLLKKMQKKSTQSVILLNCWTKIFVWHITQGPSTLFTL